LFGLKQHIREYRVFGLAAYGSSFDCIGVFGKSLEDIALVMEVIAGPDEFDSTVHTKQYQRIPRN